MWNNDFGIVVTFSGAQPGNNTVRSNTATNNTTADINFNGTGNVTTPTWSPVRAGIPGPVRDLQRVLPAHRLLAGRCRAGERERHEWLLPFATGRARILR